MAARWLLLCVMARLQHRQVLEEGVLLQHVPLRAHRDLVVRRRVVPPVQPAHAAEGSELGAAGEQVEQRRLACNRTAIKY